MPSPTVNLDAMQAAVCRGVVEGNKGLVEAFVAERNDRHDLRNFVQGNSQKVYELDSEVKLLKGFMVTLVGNGDGSTGMVPRMERDMTAMREDVSNLSSDMRLVKEGMKKLVENAEKSNGFMAGWNGAKVTLTILAALVGVLTFLLARGFHL